MKPYFGKPPWLYADILGAEQKQTPIGERCLYCNERITPAEHGSWLAVMLSAGMVRRQPYHYECHLVTVFGGPEHVVPTLTGVGPMMCDPPGKCQEGRTRRQLGREILQELIKYHTRKEKQR